MKKLDLFKDFEGKNILKKEISEEDINKLYELRKQLDTLYSKIPQYEKDMKIPTKEEEGYISFLNKFINVSKDLLGNENITYDDIVRFLNCYCAARVKLFLEDNKDDFNLAMMRADTITCDGLQYLEHSIGIKNNNEYFFEKDELYKDERNFLSLFSSDDLDNYSKLVNTIVSKYEEEYKRKK